MMDNLIGEVCFVEISKVSFSILLGFHLGKTVDKILLV